MRAKKCLAGLAAAMLVLAAYMPSAAADKANVSRCRLRGQF